ncbi:alpha-L-fucosidase [Embleya hyalina]|uniref:alpha-L-fucosidase n=1 Tax=Embleya hyalina TaxID=516124 RepID=A0A401YEY6_9ACTN|nr:alpha-L-fucosidase [Embleya hyalina]GCD93162.1 glycosyl hydrolase [Embleya hyalina]
MRLAGRRKSTGLFVTLVLLTALLVGPFPTQRAHADDGLTDVLDHKYGLFVHYVPGRTVTPGGVVVHDSNALANAFDANGFADDLAATKVQYVVFTAWHAGMVALYPSRRMLDWDLPGHRVDRDLIGDMITAVKAKGIRVYLYTHPRDGMEFTAADRRKTGWGTQPHPPGQPWNPGADFDRPRWNTFVNDVYQELMQRYGARIDGLFMDEGSPAGDSQTVLDYPRLRTTIKAVNPRAVLIQNDYGNLYGLDKGMKEYFGQNEFAQPDGDLWPGYAKPVTATLRATETSWWASETGGWVKYPPRSLFRYTVLQAGTNTDGGGTAWAAGPYAGGGWEPGVMPALRQVGAWIDPIARSVLDTRPSTSYPTKPGTRITDLPWGVATRSPDDRAEYLHVLNPPAGRTLVLPLPRDGKVFSAASLVKDGTPVALGRDANRVTLTIPGFWDANDTAIELTVADRSGPVALYRCFNPATQDHLVTTEAGCEDPSRYHFEGPLGYVHRDRVPGTVPLYRCYSPAANDHLVTTEAGCEDLSRYTFEGPLGHVHHDPTAGTVPLYRCFNPATRQHLVTTDSRCEDPSRYSLEGALGHIVN